MQLVNTLASDLQLSVGGVAAMASYAGLAPNLTGVYQFNIVVPNVGSGSAVPLTFTLAASMARRHSISPCSDGLILGRRGASSRDFALWSTRGLISRKPLRAAN